MKTRVRCFNEAAAKCCGRRKLVFQGCAQLLLASMRPQQNAAEDEVEMIRGENLILASMRPQQNAAEDRTPFPLLILDTFFYSLREPMPV